MGSECFEACIHKEETHRLADPASCLSRSAFTLKRVRNDAGASYGHTSGTCPPEQMQTDADCSSGDEMKFVRALRRRPWVNYGKFDYSSDESDSEQCFQDCPSKPALPRGVIRGCSRCDNCQKVSARWHPEEGCRPVLDDAPVFYPNEEGSVFPYELRNGHSEASVYGSRLKADSFNPSKAEQLINSKDRDHQNSQLFHEDPSSFLRSKSTSTSKFSSPKGLPLTCEDGHGEDRPDCKVLPKKQDPPSANGVETVFLSDDEEDDDIGQERKKQSVQNLVRVGNFDNSHHRNGKIDVGILPAEKGTHNDATEQKEQNLKNTRGSSMPQRDYCVIAKSAMMKECAKDESQKKQHEYPKGNNSADLQSSFAGKPLSKVGTLCTLDARELQDLFPTDISIQSRDSLRPNSIDKTTLVGKHSNSEEPCSSAKTDENEATDFYVNPLSNQRNADIDCSNRLNINKDLHTARVASPCDASYNVDLLEIGAVQPRKYWYNSRTIFPKGFKSSVRFYSVVDPTQMCNYISEVLDAGLLGPLFKVIVEECPTEVFIHVSVDKCWELVQERLNQEIRRQRSLGKHNLPPLQPPGSLDGLEMFGFTSPPIIQAIEALDRDHR